MGCFVCNITAATKPEKKQTKLPLAVISYLFHQSFIDGVLFQALPLRGGQIYVLGNPVGGRAISAANLTSWPCRYIDECTRWTRPAWLLKKIRCLQVLAQRVKFLYCLHSFKIYPDAFFRQRRVRRTSTWAGLFLVQSCNRHPASYAAPCLLSLAPWCNWWVAATYINRYKMNSSCRVWNFVFLDYTPVKRCPYFIWKSWGVRPTDSADLRYRYMVAPDLLISLRSRVSVSLAIRCPTIHTCISGGKPCSNSIWIAKLLN